MVGVGPFEHILEPLYGISRACCGVCDLAGIQGRLAYGGQERVEIGFYQVAWLSAIFIGWTVTVALMAILVGFLLVPVMAVVTLAPFVQASYEAYTVYRGGGRRYL